MTRTERQIEEVRKGDAVVPVGARPGGLVWVEQVKHAFLFGCVGAELPALAAADQAHYEAQLEELFDRREPGTAALPVEIAEPIPLGRVQRDLTRQALGGRRLHVHLSSAAVADADERAGARRLAELYTLCFAHPSVDAIIWHGFWDGDANAPGGGLLRRDFSPKPAYRVLHKLIHMYWHTRATGLSDGDGCFRFRGFWGTYRVGVAAAAGGTTVTSFCHLPPVRAC